MSESESKQDDEELPPEGEHVLLDCEHFTCLGYLDHDGKWKDAYHHAEVERVISWRPV